MHTKAYVHLKFYSFKGKNQEIPLATCNSISEIYILNNKKFKWRYYYYGQENRVGLPQYSASFPLYGDKVDLKEVPC
jgi:hypothetical protein